jgi:regulator of protease activity HflC (stomatin/prohibitin superfamily)
MFKPFSGGLQHEKLPSGSYWTGLFNHLVDFDITYSTHTEQIETTSSQDLPMTLVLSVRYRPVAEQIYELYSEIGANYYEEVIAPEFKSAARGVFARHSYQELLKKNESIEDEVEADLRRRTTGMHVEISSVTLERIAYADEIKHVNEARIASEQDAVRQRTIAESEDARRRLQIKNQDEQDRIAGEATLRHKHQDVELAKQQSELDRVKQQSEAETGLIRAKAEAEERKVTAVAQAEETRLLARAEAEKLKASNQTLTPLAVMMHGYDALKALGGTDTHIMIGDWSKLPNFMFPPAFQNTLHTAKAAASESP